MDDEDLLSTTSKKLTDAIAACPRNISLIESLFTILRPLTHLSACTSIEVKHWKESLISITQFAQKVITSLASLDLSTSHAQRCLQQLQKSAINLHYHLDLTGFHSSFFPSHIHTILISNLILSVNGPILICPSQSNLATASNQVSFEQIKSVVTNLPLLLHCIEIFLNTPMTPFSPATCIIAASKAYEDRLISNHQLSSDSKMLSSDGKRFAAIQEKVSIYIQQLRNSLLSPLDKSRLETFLTLLWSEQFLSPEVVHMTSSISPYNTPDLIGIGNGNVIYKAVLVLKQGSQFLWTTGIVLKSISLDNAAQAKSNTFWYETLRLRCLSHPCILTYYGAHWPFSGSSQSISIPQSSGSAILGVEQMTHSLRNAINLPALNGIEQRTNILLDIADALRYLHRNHSRHGALIPDNILLRIEDMKMYGHAKIDPTNIITNILRPRTLSTGTIQHLMFYPPEAVNGSDLGYYTADIWSFGVLACFLMAKRVDEVIYTNLFFKKGPVVMAMEWHNRITSKRLRQLVAKCLKLDPTHRISSEVLYSQLHKILLNSDIFGDDNDVSTDENMANDVEIVGTSSPISRPRNHVNDKFSGTNVNNETNGHLQEADLSAERSYSDETLSASSNRDEDSDYVNEPVKRKRRRSASSSKRKRRRTGINFVISDGDEALLRNLGADFLGPSTDNEKQTDKNTSDENAGPSTRIKPLRFQESRNQDSGVNRVTGTPIAEKIRNHTPNEQSNKNDQSKTKHTTTGSSAQPPSLLISEIETEPLSTGAPITSNETLQNDKDIDEITPQTTKMSCSVPGELKIKNREDDEQECRMRSSVWNGRTRRRTRRTATKSFASDPSILELEEEILSGSSGDGSDSSALLVRPRGRPQKTSSRSRRKSGQDDLSLGPSLGNQLLTNSNRKNSSSATLSNGFAVKSEKSSLASPAIWPEKPCKVFLAGHFSTHSLPSLSTKRLMEPSEIQRIQKNASKYPHTVVTTAAIQLEEGLGITRCPRSAHDLYKYSAGLGDPVAQVRLGALYERGLGTRKDHTVAFGYYQNAVKGGSMHGSIRLAECYAQGQGVAKCVKTAAKHIMDAVQSRIPEALFRAGVYHEEGIGMEPNLKSAFNYYTDAARDEHAGAYYRLACMYNDGKYCSVDVKQAFEFHTRAAKLGCVEAKVKLAGYYARGISVKKSIPKAVELYKEAAEQEDPAAMLALGLLHEDGHGVKQSPDSAFRLYKRAAKAGYPPAITAFGQCYFWGYGVHECGKTAVQQYILASKQGDALAHCELGTCYREGFGVSVDIKKALKHFRIAADKGNEIAHVQLGECYYSGIGVEVNLETAAHHFKKAADLGAAEGYRWIGECYCEGSGIEKDLKKGIECYKKGVELGSAFASTSLGSCYERGHGVEVNKMKAINLYKKASDMGDHTAMNNLGLMYEQGKFVKQDYKRAVSYYKKAIEHGSVEALCNLADCYATGLGTDKNMSKAIELYKDASTHGMSGATCELGSCYYYGKGVTKNYQKALELFQQASDSEPEGLRQLGTAYYDGHGVEQDYKKAISFYERAIEGGNNEANFNMGICLLEGKGVNKDESKAFQLFEKAAKEGHKMSMLAMGNMLFEGRGVEQDYEKAVKYMTDAKGVQVPGT